MRERPIYLTVLALHAILGCGTPSSEETDSDVGAPASSEGATPSTGTETTGSDPTSTGPSEETSGSSTGEEPATQGSTTVDAETDHGSDTGTTGPASCDPEIAPTLGDRDGASCCTMEDSCAGDGVEGPTPTAADIGDVLACRDGRWTRVLPTESWCEEECAKKGADVHASGCVWRTQDGLPVRIACTCSRG